MGIEKKDLDWGNLDFSYRKTDYSYVSNYKDGAWDEGCLTTDHSITLSECAGIFHYCQEASKALRRTPPRTATYLSALPRHERSAHGGLRRAPRDAAFPVDRFVDAVKQVRRRQRRMGAALWFRRHALRAPS